MLICCILKKSVRVAYLMLALEQTTQVSTIPRVLFSGRVFLNERLSNALPTGSLAIGQHQVMRVEQTRRTIRVRVSILVA